ncbi:amino acid transporter AVT1C-like [Coffea eugenioides]|nr:amino acid transporter AVT1C-like isoform X2 [Coffea eugenioides]XP_027172877.1 amino acid transporter AVT1C-like [Coffea eugenioides]
MEIILILAVILMIMRTKGRRANLSPPLGLKVTDSVFSSEALGFLEAVIFLWQSIDLYSSVPSPSLNFLGMPTLSRLGSSFISSSLTRRYTPEVLPSLQKPLLPPVANARQPPERRSSHSLLPSIQRKPSLRKATADRKSCKVSHEVSLPRQSSYGQAVVNGINVLCGVGILSTPYAVKEGGWVGLSILFIFAGWVGLLCCFLLRWDSPAFLFGQSTWARDLPGYWPCCLRLEMLHLFHSCQIQKLDCIYAASLSLLL